VTTDPRAEGDGWIGIDFDGTLARYDRYRGEAHFGEPIEPMVRRVRAWLRDGRDVRLFTARRASPGLRRWSAENLGRVLPVTATKDHELVALIDDRAVGAERNTGAVDENRLAELLKVIERLEERA
jgi:hypothetical protein